MSVADLADGIHLVGMDTYRGWDAINASLLNRVHRSPSHAYHYMTHPDRKTAAMTQGSAIHTAVLESELLESRYHICPPENKNSAKYKRKARELEDQGYELLTPTQWDTCLAVREAVFQHAEATKILRQATHMEASVLATDPITGERLKMRADILTPTLVVDVKSARDGSPEEFARQAYKLGYHRSGAFYLDVLDMIGVRRKHFVYLVVENTPPHDVACYYWDPGSLEMGRNEYRRALKRFIACRTQNRWPGYADTVQMITLPRWVVGLVEEDE